MDQDQAIIREKVLRFYQSAKQLFPIKKMLLYGSYAKGTATENSDIDVAVVVDQADHSKRIEITAKLFHAAFDIDAAIEPKCIFWDEYVNHDKASILSEIINKAIEIPLIEQKKGFVMFEQYNTIKEIVFDMIRKTQGNVNYDELEKKVLSHFPDSAFKKSHWSWYRNQCSTGKYAGEFSKGEKENLSKSVHRKHKERISTGQKEESDELKTIEITKEVLRVVEQVIQSALEYERITGETRKLGITGEVGEILACYHLGLRLCVDPRAAGFDAVDFEGRKVQIKTRRSETDGLPKDAGRIGTFSKHTFDYALLVLLDRQYHVAEIWRGEYDDVLPLIEKQKRRNPNLSLFKKVSKRIWPKKSPEFQFWAWFTKNEDMLFYFERNQDRTFGKLRAAMSEVHPDLTFEFGPVRNGKREFVISADGLKDAFAAVESLHASAPVLTRWIFVKFRPRRSPMTIQIGDLRLEPTDLEVAIEADSNRVGLTVFMKGYDESRKNQFTQVAFIMLDQAIGEYDMVTKVGFIEIEPFENEPTYRRHTLDNLPKIFDEFTKK